MKGIVATGCGSYTRKQTDELNELVRKEGAKGLVAMFHDAD